MSDNWIIIIPEEPAHIPSEKAQEEALALFRRFAPHADEVKKEVSPEIRFVDCGANFSNVCCPHCESELELDWWQELMDKEAEARFPIQNFSLPCCGRSASLQTLQYDWPQGFARFSVEAMNPNVPDLSEEQLAEFEQTLGCPIRKVILHL